MEHFKEKNVMQFKCLQENFGYWIRSGLLQRQDGPVKKLLTLVKVRDGDGLNLGGNSGKESKRMD